MNDVKLRLDYFLSLGLKLVEGDCVSADAKSTYKIRRASLDNWNVGTDGDCECFIKSFTTRKNTGVQPAVGNVPVVITWGDGSAESVLSWQFNFYEYEQIQSWRPDLDALIKMQMQHDEFSSSDAEWKNGDECISNGDLFYYVGKTPLVKPCTYGDCIIQLHDGRPVSAFASELTKPETQEQKAERELEAAKEKQININVNFIMTWASLKYNDALFLATRQQNAGMLCEILLPLEK